MEFDDERPIPRTARCPTILAFAVWDFREPGASGVLLARLLPTGFCRVFLPVAYLEIAQRPAWELTCWRRTSISYVFEAIYCF